MPLYPAEESVRFMTPNGLPLADGYNGVVMTEKGPMVEFLEQHMNFANITVPQPMEWRRKHPEAYLR